MKFLEHLIKKPDTFQRRRFAPFAPPPPVTLPTAKSGSKLQINMINFNKIILM